MLWATAHVDAQPPGQLVGTVYDASGAALPGVTVTVQGAAERVSSTGADGRFAILALPDGEYELSAALSGFATATRTFRITAGNPASLSLTLAIQITERAIVTAEKTGARDLQTVPMAVSVLSGPELSRVRAHTVEDIAGRAPTVTFSQNTGFSQLTIRGIGTNVVFAGSDPSSAVYVDGVYLARPAMVLDDLMDLERVEVLRGPQGTLYGRNVVGGALNVITAGPTNDLDVSASLSAGSLGALRTEARLSGALVPSKILGSVSFLRGVREGFVRDLTNADHPLGGEDVTAARAKLQMVFNQQSTLIVSTDVTYRDPTPLVYAKVLAVKPGFQISNPPDLHEVRTSTPAESRHLQYGASARLSLSVAPDMTLTSLSAFRRLDYNLQVDADITELDLTVSHVHEIHRQASQELTLSRGGQRLRWIGGMFLFGEKDRQPTSVLFGGPRVENRLNPTVDASTSAVFGQATLVATKRLSATAGLRYAHEKKSIVNQGGLYPFDTPEAPVAGSTYSYTDTLAHAAWTPKAGVDLRVSDRMLAYVSATRGFKTGGFNLTSPEAGRGYAPEWAWSYETGLKATGARGQTTFNVAGFYTDYTDMQVQTAIRPGVIDISNAAQATIRGIEVEGGAEPFRALRLGGHIAWLDTAYDQYVAVGVGGVTGDVTGHRLNNAPQWSGRTWVEWTTQIAHAAAVSFLAELRAQSTVYFTPFNDAVQRQRPYGLLDVSAEIRPQGWCCTIGVYARNLTNEDYITGTFSSPPPAIGGRPGEPRHVGIQLTVR